MPNHAIPAELLHHPEHTWARIEGDLATVGITLYAQDLLGEIVFWDAPRVGERIAAGQPFTELESTKAISEVIAPLSGEIVAINDAASREPEIINDEPYGAGWLVRIAASDLSESAALLTAADYHGLTSD